MSQPASIPISEAIESAVGANDRTRREDIRYLRHHVSDEELFVEVGLPGGASGGAESMIGYSSVIAKGLLKNCAGDRTVHLALVLAGDRLARLTVTPESADLNDSEAFRQQCTHSLRVD
ncbi:hypothetical protein C449_14337 [Halococcus saccharolyticus DSM 5350]|uniref:Uncharacterized protein n=1 Tax=Halococcus saccharolyticus DSM 5350 TaxID=1227455 RepID=M0MES0_9EURY|nr:hypothetical protein C449_14337 [Halococcus saccharolyticus DSM 5350]